MSEAVQRFVDFIKIPTVSSQGPSGVYQQAAEWLSDYGKEVGLQTEIIQLVPGKPVVLMSLPGQDPSLPGLLLNSHYDVVPAVTEKWNYPPFEGIRLPDGRIVGRGTQDMKCVCIQYLEAMRKLLKTNTSGVPFKRRVYLSFVPDEEIGGKEGMGAFLASPNWQSIQPIGFALDEGLANPTDAFTLFYGERQVWWLLVRAQGPTGHGSRFIPDTAVSKLINMANKALKFREEEESKLGHEGGCKHASAKKLGDVTTLNLTMLKAGVSLDQGKTYCLNVIPTTAEAGFDVRISPTMKLEDFRKLLDEWTQEEGLSWEFAPWTTPLHQHFVTSLDPQENPWWSAFSKVCQELDIKIEPEIFPAATDSRFIRQIGIPAFGFSPINKSPILLHEHDESLSEDIFLKGIDIYEKIIPALANL